MSDGVLNPPVLVQEVTPAVPARKCLQPRLGVGALHCAGTVGAVSLTKRAPPSSTEGMDRWACSTTTVGIHPSPCTEERRREKRRGGGVKEEGW